MGNEIKALTVILNNTAVAVSAGNAVTTNPDGTVNVTGTVIGVGQTAQSLVSLGTMTVECKAIAIVPGAGTVLGAAGATDNIINIKDDVDAGKSPAAADVSLLCQILQPFSLLELQ